jgi:hypothetical protein
MVLVRRTLLIVMVLTLPAACAAGLYYLSLYMLEVTHRVANNQTMLYMAYAEFGLFTFGALMEAKSRWSPTHR